MVSIITVNFNNHQVTLELLASIERLHRTDLQVIVVDNGSRVNPEKSFTEKFPWVTFVRSEENLGFAGGNNLGIKHAIGNYLFFVNNDTEFKEDFLDRFKTVLDKHPRIGILCPLLYYYQSGQVQYAGYTPLNRITGRNECLTEIQMMNFEGLVETSYAHGAAMMMRRSALEQVGPMSENYFLYYEEYDWCEHFRKAGFSMVVDTQSPFFHKESQTVGPIGELKSYFLTRNRILFMRRNVPAFFLALFWIYFLFMATPGKLFNYLWRREFLNIRAHMEGIWWNFRFPTFSDHLGYKFNHLRKA
ncbi:MAG: glycosyltransferase family 2 protein [Bacteroidota bacterium]